jgi:hypothetical protein
VNGAFMRRSFVTAPPQLVRGGTPMVTQQR